MGSWGWVIFFSAFLVLGGCLSAPFRVEWGRDGLGLFRLGTIRGFSPRLLLSYPATILVCGGVCSWANIQLSPWSWLFMFVLGMPLLVLLVEIPNYLVGEKWELNSLVAYVIAAVLVGVLIPLLLKVSWAILVLFWLGTGPWLKVTLLGAFVLVCIATAADLANWDK